MQRKIKPFSDTGDKNWKYMTEEHVKVKQLWKAYIDADAELGNLCQDKHDPIGVTFATLNSPELYGKSDHPVWVAGLKASNALMKYQKYAVNISKTHHIHIRTIKETAKQY